MVSKAILRSQYRLFYLTILIAICVLPLFIIFLSGKSLLKLRYSLPHPPAFEEVGANSAQGNGISFPLPNSRESIIAISPENRPYITWVQAEKSGVFLAYWDGASWVNLSTEAIIDSSRSDEASRSPSIAFAPDGSLYLAWDQKGSIHISRWDGITWQEVGNGSIEGTGISQANSISRVPSVAVALDGTVYVAWQTFEKELPQIYVRRWNGTDWAYLYDLSSEDNSVNQTVAAFTPQIVVDSSGIPYVLWADTSSVSN